MRAPHSSTIGNMFPLSEKTFREPSYLASMPENFWCGIVNDAPDLGRWRPFGERARRRQRSAGSAWLKSRLATERTQWTWGLFSTILFYLLHRCAIKETT